MAKDEIHVVHHLLFPAGCSSPMRIKKMRKRWREYFKKKSYVVKWDSPVHCRGNRVVCILSNAGSFFSMVRNRINTPAEDLISRKFIKKLEVPDRVEQARRNRPNIPPPLAKEALEM